MSGDNQLATVVEEQERAQAAVDLAQTFLNQLAIANDPRTRLLLRGQNAQEAVSSLLAAADECDPAAFLAALTAAVKDMRDDLEGDWKYSPAYLTDCHEIRRLQESAP